MDISSKIFQVILFMPGFLFSLSIHEAAHAYVANRLGDPTAKNLGRVTLNPLAHIDPIGTLLLPIASMMGLLGRFGIGWGKPVPVRMGNLRNPIRDGMFISAAGPLSNLALAIVLAILIRIFFMESVLTTLTSAWGTKTFYTVVHIFIMYFYLNLALCFFNLIPCHPLDGGAILTGLLPSRLALRFHMFTLQYGMYILLGLFLTGGLRYILKPVWWIGGVLLGM